MTGLALFMAGIISDSAQPAWYLLIPGVMFVMTGIQLSTSWLLVKLLTELSKRDLKVEADLGLNGAANSDENAVIFSVTKDASKVMA
jgi:hypothetical protein